MVRDHLFEKSKTIEDNLSELILDGNQIEGKNVYIDHDGKEYKYNIKDRTEDEKKRNF